MSPWTPGDIMLTTFSIMMINYVSRGRLAAQLEKADLKPVRFHDVRARTGGAEVSILIEIEGFVEEGDARFFALSEGLGEAFETATPIGAYPLPEMIGVKEKE